MARILASQPKTILLDEPFSALDSYLQYQLELELMETLEQFSGALLWVSHDRSEVFRNCQQVCVLDRGRSQGTFTLDELFHHPVTEAAARLSGCKNYADVSPSGSSVSLSEWGVTLDCGRPVPPEIRRIGLRARRIFPASEHTPNAIPCTVLRVIEDVFTTIIILRPENAVVGAPPLRMEISKDIWQSVPDKSKLTVAVRPEDVLLLK